MKTIAIIQARMSSTRLPGKVLMNLCGKPLLELLLERLSRASSLDSILVATSDSPADDVLAERMEVVGQPVVRGSEQDVLGRFFLALQQEDSPAPEDIIFRFTADNPLIDPALVDDATRMFRAQRPDYLKYGLGLPLGMGLELCTREALEDAHRNARTPEAREHVTAHLYQHPETYRCLTHRMPEDHSDLRWTVDTPEDYRLVGEIYQALYPKNPAFSYTDILEAYRTHPHWRDINANIVQKTLQGEPP